MRGLRRRLGCSNILPVPVEYIHADKRQMIQTDWVPGIDPKIEIDWRLDNFVAEEGLNNTLFQTLDAGINVGFTANFGGSPQQYNQIFLWNDKDYGSGGAIITAGSFYYTKEHNVFSMSATECVYLRLADWDTAPKWTTVSLNPRTAANTSPMKLLGSTNAPLNRCDVWLYGVKCWNDGVLEREYVPAKRNGVYGLWDKVEGKFLTSITGVNFLGPE